MNGGSPPGALGSPTTPEPPARGRRCVARDDERARPTAVAVASTRTGCARSRRRSRTRACLSVCTGGDVSRVGSEDLALARPSRVRSEIRSRSTSGLTPATIWADVSADGAVAGGDRGGVADHHAGVLPAAGELDGVGGGAAGGELDGESHAAAVRGSATIEAGRGAGGRKIGGSPGRRRDR